MSNVKQKYIKNNKGDIISPMISIDSIYTNTGESIGQIIADDNFEKQTYIGQANCITNGTKTNPTDVIVVQNTLTPVSVGGELRLSEGYYEVIITSRYPDTTTGADCSQALVVYNSSGTQISTINIWEKNYKRLRGYLDCIVYVPDNGYIKVDNYNDSNTSGTNKVEVVVKRV